MSDIQGAQQTFDSIYAAKLAADTDALETLLGDTFTLTHMTGTVQSKNEWLHDIETGRMTYLDAKPISTEGSSLADGVILIDRKDLVHARIYGMESWWNLRLKGRFAEKNGSWVALDIKASTF